MNIGNEWYSYKMAENYLLKCRNNPSIIRVDLQIYWKRRTTSLQKQFNVCQKQAQATYHHRRKTQVRVKHDHSSVAKPSSTALPLASTPCTFIEETSIISLQVPNGEYVSHSFSDGNTKAVGEQRQRRMVVWEHVEVESRTRRTAVCDATDTTRRNRQFVKVLRRWI